MREPYYVPRDRPLSLALLARGIDKTDEQADANMDFVVRLAKRVVELEEAIKWSREMEAYLCGQIALLEVLQ